MSYIIIDTFYFHFIKITIAYLVAPLAQVRPSLMMVVKTSSCGGVSGNNYNPEDDWLHRPCLDVM